MGTHCHVAGDRFPAPNLQQCFLCVLSVSAVIDVLWKRRDTENARESIYWIWVSNLLVARRKSFLRLRSLKPKAVTSLRTPKLLDSATVFLLVFFPQPFVAIVQLDGPPLDECCRHLSRRLERV